VSVASFDDLLDSCDAVAFAVPPDIQADLALRAAKRGKHLLLEKPLAFDLADAEQLLEVVEGAGVASLMVLRNRFDPAVVEFLAAARDVHPRAMVGRFISDAALPPSDFATLWRVERGALLDLAPHAIDIVEAVLGPVEHVSAVGDPTRWIALTTTHSAGTIGQLSFSLTTPGADGELHLEVIHEEGSLHLARLDDDLTCVQRSLMAAFVQAVSTGQSHMLDVRRGVELQRVIAAAEASV
jgi:predicted dehydrogenase